MSEIKMLPLPKPKGDVAGGGLDWTDEEMQDYSRANMAPLIIEIEALRAEVELARKARRLQRDHFGDGMSLHLSMMDWASEYDTLAGKQQGGAK